MEVFGERPSFLGDEEEQVVHMMVDEAMKMEKRRVFLESRRGPLGIRLGASDISSAIGVNRYIPPVALYERLCAELDGTPMQRDYEKTAPTEHGHRCEPLTSAVMERELGLVAHESVIEMHHSDPEMDTYMSCNIDRHVIGAGEPYERWRRQQLENDSGGDGGDEGSRARAHSRRYRDWIDVEIKSPYSRMLTSMPDAHRVQVLTNMFITGKRMQYYAVGHFPHIEEHKHTHEPRGYPSHPLPPSYRRLDSYDSCLEFACYEVPRDDHLLQTFILPRVFYLFACVLNRSPPPARLYDGEPPHGFSRDFLQSFEWASADCRRLPDPTKGFELLKVSHFKRCT